MAEGVDVIMLRNSAINCDVTVWGTRTSVSWLSPLKSTMVVSLVTGVLGIHNWGNVNCAPSFNYTLVFRLRREEIY